MVASLYVDEEAQALGSRAAARAKLADECAGRATPSPAAASAATDMGLATTPLLSEKERQAMMAAADVTGHGLAEVQHA